MTPPVGCPFTQKIASLRLDQGGNQFNFDQLPAGPHSYGGNQNQHEGYPGRQRNSRSARPD